MTKTDRLAAMSKREIMATIHRPFNRKTNLYFMDRNNNRINIKDLIKERKYVKI